jgi:hypothetical protein
MARARATEPPRSRTKAVLIEEIARGIEQFQDLLTSIEDFTREGFPYRDAARAKAELQLRECVRRAFGERSPEFQTYRNYRLRTTTHEDTMQNVAVVKSLIHALEEKKVDLQGGKPTTQTPTMTLVPSTASTPPIAETPAPVPAAVLEPVAVAAMMPDTSSASPTPLPPAPSETPQDAPPVTPGIPAITAVPQPAVSAAPSLPAPAVDTPTDQDTFPPGHPIMPKASEVQPPAPLPPPSPAELGADPILDHPITPALAPASPDARSAIPTATLIGSPAMSAEHDSLELVRKVCLRFHAVTRQLRLRKDYRATLEVEDDYDLQDLFSALLKVEFDEVGADEWTPPYTEGAPRTAFLLHGDHIAVVAKKTRPGLTTKELVDQVAADSARYSARDQCHALFCFIYDPEGRIGSPKRLETDLTSVSDRYMIEVLVAPK